MKKIKHKMPLTYSNMSTAENLASRFDPNGSYTGVAKDGDRPITPDGERPVQDADDL